MLKNHNDLHSEFEDYKERAQYDNISLKESVSEYSERWEVFFSPSLVIMVLLYISNIPSNNVPLTQCWAQSLVDQDLI